MLPFANYSLGFVFQKVPSIKFEQLGSLVDGTSTNLTWSISLLTRGARSPIRRDQNLYVTVLIPLKCTQIREAEVSPKSNMLEMPYFFKLLLFKEIVSFGEKKLPVKFIL